MATKFIETPDATQSTEFWASVTGTVVYDNSVVLSSGLASWKAGDVVGVADYLRNNIGLAAAGNRYTNRWKFANLPTATASFVSMRNSAATGCYDLRITSGGVLQLWESGLVTQLGSNGSTISAGTEYRISLAHVLTNTTTYDIRVFVNGVLDITVTNGAALPSAVPQTNMVGWYTASGVSKFVNFGHTYLDNGTTLDDVGDIRITSKLPAAVNNNNFDTTIGSGAVNERPISETNGMQQAGSTQVDQDYTLQTASAGDVDLTGVTLVARTAWIWAKRGSGTTGSPSLIDNGGVSAITLNTTSALFRLVTDSASYPSNIAGIGLRSGGNTADAFLYDGGTLIAYKLASGGGILYGSGALVDGPLYMGRLTA